MSIDRKFYFLGGLPRAGSTLLCNILAQNPEIYATHTSGCMDVMFGVRNSWNQLIEHQAHPDKEAERRVLGSIPRSYYETVEKPVVIDKCRGWLSLIEMAEFALGAPVKIIVPVRDTRDVLASFETLWRENAKTGQVAGEQQAYFQMQTVEGRCEYLLRNDQPVGLAYNRIKDAIARGHRDKLHFVNFEELTAEPSKTMIALYDFLGLPFFKHDFDHVEQVTTEDDSIHGFAGLHTIRPKVSPSPSRWKKVLGDFAEKYAVANQIWK